MSSRKRMPTKRQRAEISRALSDILDLECPVCYQHLQPPIFQCPNGHLLCSHCRQKLQKPPKCPNCRKGIGNIRCLVAERVVANLQLPCKFASAGCTEVLVVEERAQHENSCPFRPCICPETENDFECKWEGPLGEVIEHLRTMHSGSDAKFANHSGGQVAGKVFELLLNDVDPDDPEPQEWLMFTKVENKDYLIKGIWQKDENFSVHVRSVADESSSTYEVRMNLKDDEVAIWRGRARCIREQLGFHFRRCLNVPVECVQLHSVGTNVAAAASATGGSGVLPAAPSSGTSSLSSSVSSSCSSTSSSSSHGLSHAAAARTHVASMNRSGSSNALANHYANSNRASSLAAAAVAAASSSSAAPTVGPAASLAHVSSSNSLSSNPPSHSHGGAAHSHHSHASQQQQRMSGVLHPSHISSSPNASAFSSSSPSAARAPHQGSLARSQGQAPATSSSSAASSSALLAASHSSSPLSSPSLGPSSHGGGGGGSVNMSLVGSSQQPPPGILADAGASGGGSGSALSDQAKGGVVVAPSGGESLYYLSILLKIDPFHD